MWWLFTHGDKLLTRSDIANLIIIGDVVFFVIVGLAVVYVMFCEKDDKKEE